MSARLLIEKSDKPTLRFQLLPFSLNHNGPAHVSKFFESTVVVEQSQNLQASFRGKPLRGRQVSVPAGFTGLVLRSEGKKKNQTFSPTGTFDSVISWKWDQNPDSDPFGSVFDWTELSAAIHSSPEPQTKL